MILALLIILFLGTVVVTIKFFRNAKFYGELDEALIGVCLGIVLAVTLTAVFIQFLFGD